MLNQVKIKKEIENAFLAALKEKERTSESVIEDVADKIATTIVNAITSMQITYNAGLMAPPNGGPVTGTFTYQIS